MLYTWKSCKDVYRNFSVVGHIIECTDQINTIFVQYCAYTNEENSDILINVCAKACFVSNIIRNTAGFGGV
jgi:hypothetical protein